MFVINDAWAGDVEFWELIFGTWTVYAALVLFWERVLRQPLEEWRYVLLVFLGASFFWINHYFQRASFWLIAINVYTLIVWIGWYFIAVRGRGSLLWTVLATLSFWLFTAAYIGFEQFARWLEQYQNVPEFGVMLMSYFGFAWLIWWRRRAPEQRRAGS
jgi:hypothetical protein